MVSLSDVTHKVPNIKPEEEPERVFRYVDISGVDNDAFQIVETKEFPGAEAPSRARRPIRSGDVLFSNVRTYLKNIAIVPSQLDRQVASTGFTVLRPNGAVLTDFLYRWILTDQFVDAVTPHQTGSSYPATTDRVVQGQMIPLPPLAEQERIVAKVEALLEHVRSVRHRLAVVSDILKHFRQAVLTHACSGKLTENWRTNEVDLQDVKELASTIKDSFVNEDKMHGGKAGNKTEEAHDLTQDTIPDLWLIIELKWLCHPGKPICYGILKPGPDIRDGIPYVRVADYPEDKIELDKVRHTTIEIAKKYNRSVISEGDILLSIRGTVGRIARVPMQLDGANITQDTARISPHPLVNSSYIEWYLRSPSLQRRMQRCMKGVAIRGINIGDVRPLQIALPPIEEQGEIVRRVETLFKQADSIERRVKIMKKQTQALTQSILSKAFRGELVPTEAELAEKEGRNYESADQLLTRIRKELAQSTPEKITQHQMSKRKKATMKHNPVEILQKAGKSFTPEELFQKAGCDQADINTFYEQLRAGIKAGHIIQEPKKPDPSNPKVLLRPKKG